MARRIGRHKGVVSKLLTEDGKDVIEQKQNLQQTIRHYRETVFDYKPDVTDEEIEQFLKDEAREHHWGRGCMWAD